MPTHRELYIPTAIEMAKPAPFANVSIAMHVSFKQMVAELRENYRVSTETAIETLLKFCATAVDMDDINDFFIAQTTTAPKSRVRSVRRRKA